MAVHWIPPTAPKEKGARRYKKTLPPGVIWLWSDDPDLNLLALVGPEEPKITGGFGGWDTTARPGQVSMTTWNGVDPLTLTINLIIDHFQSGHSVEPEIRALMRVARGYRDSDPGIVYITGLPALPATRWTITNIEFNDSLRRGGGERLHGSGQAPIPADFSRIRSNLTITFQQYVPPVYERLRKYALRKPKRKTVIYTVRKHDTPAKIAKARHTTWKVLQELNGRKKIRTANQHLKVGDKLRVPVKPVHKGHSKHKHKGKGK